MSDMHITSVQTQNSRGEWVPSIPLPLFLPLRRHQCECKRTFWTKEGYEGHYALKHILYPPPMPPAAGKG